MKYAVFAAVHLCEDSQQSTCVCMHVCAHTYTPMCTWTHTHAGTVCLTWQTNWQATTQFTSFYLPSHVPCVPPHLSLHPFFFFPSFNTSLACSYLLPYHCLLPQITAAERLKGQRETVEKERKQKMLKGRGGISGGRSFFLSNKRPVGIHLRPICWHRATEWAASWLDQRGWKIVVGTPTTTTAVRTMTTVAPTKITNINNQNICKKKKTTNNCTQHHRPQSQQ